MQTLLNYAGRRRRPIAAFTGAAISGRAAPQPHPVVVCATPPRRVRPAVIAQSHAIGGTIQPPSGGGFTPPYPIVIKQPIRPKRMSPAAYVAVRSTPPLQGSRRPAPPVVIRQRAARRGPQQSIVISTDLGDVRRSIPTVIPRRPAPRPARAILTQTAIQRGPGSVWSGGLPVMPTPVIITRQRRYQLRPVIAQASATGGLLSAPRARPLVVVRSVVQPRRGRPIVTGSRISIQASRPQPVVIQKARSLLRLRTPIIQQTDVATPYSGAAPRPVVIRAPRRVLLPTRIVLSAPQHGLPSPATAYPRPQPIVIRVLPRRQKWQPVIVLGSGGAGLAINPPQPPNLTNAPTDLVAAAILWMRNEGFLQAATGDGPGSLKYYSDLAAVGTSLPYVAFDEPEESDSYESDGTYLTEGVLTVIVAQVGKLASRQLAELVYTALEDARLYFTDGNLLYLRRSKRRFLPIKEPGPGNTVVYKRPLEFKYFIERRK